jgi:ATP-dependent DNA ligase
MPAPLRFIEPMECLPVEKAPYGLEWQYELKLDGYRAIAVKDAGEVSLYSRNGNSFNAKFPSIVTALEQLRQKRFVIDGEIVALDENGRHSFELLQRIKSSKAPLRYYVFDLLKLDVEDLIGKPFSERRERLEEALHALPHGIQLSPLLSGDANVVLAHVRQFEFEGVIAKRRDSLYAPGETSSFWQKQKTQRSDDFLLGGYVPGRHGVDELVVGEKRDGKDYFAASIKNGFVPATRARVFEKVRGRKIDVPIRELARKERAPSNGQRQNEKGAVAKAEACLRGCIQRAHSPRAFAALQVPAPQRCFGAQKAEELLVAIVCDLNRFDHGLPSIVVNTDFAAPASEMTFDVVDGVTLSVRASEYRFNAGAFKGYPASAEFLCRFYVDRSHWLVAEAQSWIGFFSGPFSSVAMT